MAEDPSKQEAGAGGDPPAGSGGFPTRGPDLEPMRKDLCPSLSFIEPSRPRGPIWPGRCLEIDSALPMVVLVYDPRFLHHVPPPLPVERPARPRPTVPRSARDGPYQGCE